MSDKLPEIVDVSISRETAAVSQAGFGTLLVVGDSGVFPEVDVVTITVDADLVTGNSTLVTVNGTALSPVVFASDHATTMTAIATAIQALSEVATATAGGTGTRTITITAAAGETVIVNSVVTTLGATQPTWTISRTAAARIRFYSDPDSILDDGFVATNPEYIAANAAFSQSPGPTQVAIGAKWSGDADYPAALAAIREESDDWYGLVIEDRTKSVVLAVAAWVESKMKIFGTASNDTDILGTGSTDVAAELAALNYDRTFCMYHPDAFNTYPEAAWFGERSPDNPGSATWMFKTLSGVAVTTLTTTQSTNALAKACNVYESIGGVSMTRNGTMVSGEYIDVIRFVDWLQVEIETNIFSRLVNLKKISYTDGGVGIIEAELRKALDKGIRRGGLAENTDETKYNGKKYQVTVPKVADISANDKANRLLPDVSFRATLAGAIHKGEVAGVVEI